MNEEHQFKEAINVRVIGKRLKTLKIETNPPQKVDGKPTRLVKITPYLSQIFDRYCTDEEKIEKLKVFVTSVTFVTLVSSTPTGGEHKEQSKLV